MDLDPNAMLAHCVYSLFNDFKLPGSPGSRALLQVHDVNLLTTANATILLQVQYLVPVPIWLQYKYLVLCTLYIVQ